MIFSRDDFLILLKDIITKHLQKIMQDYGSINIEDKLYKLPSRDKFTNILIQTAPLFQNQNIMRQICSWMVPPLRRMIGKAESILLVCATAPAE